MTDTLLVDDGAGLTFHLEADPTSVMGLGTLDGVACSFLASGGRWWFDVANPEGGLPSDGHRRGFRWSGEHARGASFPLAAAEHLVRDAVASYRAARAQPLPLDGPLTLTDLCLFRDGGSIGAAWRCEADDQLRTLMLYVRYVAGVEEAVGYTPPAVERSVRRELEVPGGLGTLTVWEDDQRPVSREDAVRILDAVADQVEGTDERYRWVYAAMVETLG